MYWIKMASAIMTTDTKPKLAYEEVIIGDELIKICGIAKGSGMIAPNLATMLSFIFTNADVNSNLLKTLLKELLQIHLTLLQLIATNQLMIWFLFFPLEL
jgi:glutamate N-acetyltransferase/amino-acid N-acetyltransferase